MVSPDPKAAAMLERLGYTAHKRPPKPAPRPKPKSKPQPKPKRHTAVEALLAEREFVWTPGDEVRPEAVEWWLTGLVPYGCLTMAVGRGNAGKSTAVAAWAAEETRRGNRVVWLHSEESRSLHIVPKLHAAGADVSKAMFLDIERPLFDGTMGADSLKIPRDLGALEKQLEKLGCRFVVFDALTSFKPEGANSNSGDDVRAFLEPIQSMAGRLNAVVMGIAHLGKDGTRSARDSVKGGAEWTDVPRQTLAFHRNDAENAGIISDVKGNLSPTSRSIGYRFETVALPEYEIAEVGRVVFTGDVATSVDEARRAAAGGDDERQERVEAVEWLREYLEIHPGAKSADAKREAQKAGISTRTLQRARAELKVEVGYTGSPPISTWTMPDPYYSNGGTREKVGITQGHSAVPPIELAQPAVPVAQRGTAPRPADMPANPVVPHECIGSAAQRLLPGAHRCAAGCGRRVLGPATTCTNCTENKETTA